MDPPDEQKRELLRLIPQVNELAKLVGERFEDGDVPRPVLNRAVQNVLESTRESILNQQEESPGPNDLDLGVLAEKVKEEVERMTIPGYRKIINATGVIVHTNLGRAPLPRKALDAVREVAEGYSNLEYSLDSGKRGSRQDHIEPLITELAGAEAALVVNNNAAATLLVLTSLARGREVIVSRGQLIEIGDTFRLPEILRQSGARLIEVGTTNITRLTDYSNAIGPDTAMIMRIHQSNFRMVGYSEEVPMRDLAELAHTYSLPAVEDLGSGSMVDISQAGFRGEHTASESISQGADLVTFSGDKLLGGPQAGIIVGRSEYVDELRKHPLTRALRVDKMTVAALEATLAEYRDAENAWEEIPVLRMMIEPEDAVKKRAAKLKRLLDRADGVDLEYSVIKDISRAGGGSLPTAEIPTYCLSIQHPGQPVSSLEEALRESDPPVVGRVKEDRLLLDMRTVADTEIPLIGRILNGLS